MGRMESIYWEWEEAFDKFGFGDGDGLVMTHVVAEVLRSHGYEVISDTWGIHNTIIVSIKKDGEELMPIEDSGIIVGYDDPRAYLPKRIIKILDAAI